MSDDRSDAAERLLNYLAIGLEPMDAVAYYLIAHENIPLETVETASWSHGAIEGAFNRAEKKISADQPREITRDYWRSRRDEIDNYGGKVDDIRAAFELRTVRELLQNE